MPAKDTSATQSGASDQTSGRDRVAEDMATLQRHGLSAMTGMGITWAETLGDMGSEVLSFVADRIKEDVKTQHRILHCKDVNELHRIQSEFVQTAIDQYAAESGRLVEMSQVLMQPPKTDRADDL